MRGDTDAEAKQLRAVLILAGVVAAVALLALWGLLHLASVL